MDIVPELINRIMIHINETVFKEAPMVRILIPTMCFLLLASCKEKVASVPTSGDSETKKEEVVDTVDYNIIISTDDKLNFITNSFDEYKVVGKSEGFSSNIVNYVYELDGKMFVSTNSGFGTSVDMGVSWDIKRVFDGIDDGVSYNKIMYSKTGDMLYVGSNGNGMYLSANFGENFVNVTTANGLPSNTITALENNDFGNIFIGTDVGYFVTYDGDVLGDTPNYWKVDFAADAAGDGATANSNIINNIYYVGGDDLDTYVSTQSGLFLVKYEVTYDKMYLPGKKINDFVITKMGTWLVATTSGLAISYDDGVSFVYKQFNDGLPESYAGSITLDKDENIFITTRMGFAVSKDNGETFTAYNEGSGLSENRTNNILILD